VPEPQVAPEGADGANFLSGTRGNRSARLHFGRTVPSTRASRDCAATPPVTGEEDCMSVRDGPHPGTSSEDCPTSCSGGSVVIEISDGLSRSRAALKQTFRSGRTRGTDGRLDRRSYPSTTGDNSTGSAVGFGGTMPIFAKSKVRFVPRCAIQPSGPWSGRIRSRGRRKRQTERVGRHGRRPERADASTWRAMPGP